LAARHAPRGPAGAVLLVDGDAWLGRRRRSPADLGWQFLAGFAAAGLSRRPASVIGPRAAMDMMTIAAYERLVATSDSLAGRRLAGRGRLRALHAIPA